MSDLTLRAVQDETARLRRLSDDHQLLGSDLDAMRRIAAHAMERMRIAESKADDAEARAEAAEQQAARLNHDLTYLLDVAREVSDGEASRTALRIAVDQIKLAAFRLAASQPAPAVEARDE